jgi:uncharacterized membrane protein
MEKKLQLIDLYKEGSKIGIKNIIPILVNALLWLVTLWIPYLNVGTTIGLFVGIVTKMGRNEPFSMTEIFNPQYRKNMGDFFLTSGFMAMGITAASAFMVVPGIILAITWSQALLIALDKNKDPMESISLSKKVTDGNKMTIFLAFLLLEAAVLILASIFMHIPVIGILLTICTVVLCIFASIGIQAVIYKKLTESVQ